MTGVLEPTEAPNASCSRAQLTSNSGDSDIPGKGSIASVSEEPLTDRFLRRRPLPVFYHPVKGGSGRRRAFQNGWIDDIPKNWAAIGDAMTKIKVASVLVLLRCTR